MIECRFRTISPFLLVVVAISACGSGAHGTAQPSDGRPVPVIPRPKPTPADIAFMQGMIGHHAQAVVMARMVPTHSSRRDLQTLAERIIVSQDFEITFMRQWLRDHGAAVPDTTGQHDHTGMSMPMMPGMLSDQQLVQLRAARGDEFDRLFLTSMIQHHGGAIVMVDELFGTYGAGQEDVVFKFASDVAADQESEIARMRSILATMSPPAAGR